MPVLVAPLFKELRVIKVLTDDKTKKHLESLGVCMGGNITVLSSIGGSVVLLIKDFRLALDKSLATKIHVA